VGVVLAAGGYPGSYHKGDVIRGIPADTSDSKVFHAGTQLVDGQVVTNGGRVLCATALGDTVTEAQAIAYQLLKLIHWDNMYYRRDIAYRAIAREQ
jgi:phosphoribosylamine--glycine ligase